MKLDNDELYAFFCEKNILALYHANTISTCITYFEQLGLLSRGAVEKRGLYQSPQSSDEIDKVLNVWHDIFLDTVDLHSFFPRQNYYGPVSFEFDIKMVQDKNFEFWITKDNPINWTRNMPDESKYFVNVQELRDKWDTIQRQRKMVTIRNSNNPILFNYVRRILIDDPKRTIVRGVEKIHVFNESINKIKGAITSSHPLTGKFKLRTCTNCFCNINYLYQHDHKEIERLFL